ncbi:Hypothetical protein CINCED_3A013023 [Cinara cedri]|uniref:Uncharacterized protein n=1 Tax=Cinara cedri TaxID=506608 RepID=A0A5E4NJC4_9HEMI|nr:Hypothetical protein CINCED_3A013023 [Cinara cedri]
MFKLFHFKGLMKKRAKEEFINNIKTSRERVNHFYLDDNIIDSTENINKSPQEIFCDQLLTTTDFFYKKFHNKDHEKSENQEEENKPFKLFENYLRARLVETECDIPIHYCSELMVNTLPPNVVRELIRIPLKPRECTEEELTRLVNVDVPVVVLQLIGSVRVPIETEIEPKNNELDTD